MAAPFMGISVERANFSADDGRFQYYVGLKPNTPKDELDVQTRVPVEVAVSVSETGDLVDLAFELPRGCYATLVVKRITA